jgi:hypothetical protein
MEVDSNQYLIAEPIEFRMYLRGAEFPIDTLKYNWNKDTLTQKWTVLESTEVDTMMEEKGWLMERKYKLTAYDTGFLIIPPFQLNFKDSLVASNALLIRIDYPKVDLTSDIKPIGNLLDTPFQFSEIQGYVLIGVVILTILVLVGWLIRKYLLSKKKNEVGSMDPEIPMKDLIDDRIQKLDKEKLWLRGKAKEHHFEFSEVLRLMIDDLYNLKTLESTSNELLRQLSQTSFSKERYRALKEMLTFSDLVKFAKVKGEDYRHEQTIILLKEIFQEYESRENGKME